MVRDDEKERLPFKRGKRKREAGLNLHELGHNQLNHFEKRRGKKKIELEKKKKKEGRCFTHIVARPCMNDREISGEKEVFSPPT